MSRLRRYIKDNPWVAALAAILCVAAILRFQGITDRGIFDYDEAWYLLEAKSLYDAGSFLTGRLGGSIPPESGSLPADLKGYIKARGTVPITSFKPGHNLVTVLGFAVFGVHDYALLVLSALCGVLTVLCVFHIGRDMFGPKAGLVSALVLAVSAFHIGYSRSGYAQADSVFFVALGTWLWYRAYTQGPGLSWGLFLAGLSIGFAFTCHYNTALIPLILVAVEVLVCLVRGLGLSRLVKRLGLLGSGLLVPLLAFEIPGRVAKALGSAPDGFLTYTEQFFHRNTHQAVENMRLTLKPMAVVLAGWLDTEGALVLLAALLGIALSLRRLRHRPVEYALVLGLAVLPALPWLVMAKGVDLRFRLFPVMFPGLSILSGVGFVCLLECLGRIKAIRRVPSGVLVAALCGVLIGMGALRARPVLAARSTYREAADRLLRYAADHGGTVGFRPRSVWPIWNFYLSARYDDVPEDLRSRIRLYAQKDDFVPAGDFEPLDFWRYFRGVRIHQPELLTYLEGIRESAEPVVRVPNPMAMSTQTCFEMAGISIDRALEAVFTRYPQSVDIEIYDLRNRPRVSEIADRSSRTTFR